MAKNSSTRGQPNMYIGCFVDVTVGVFLNVCARDAISRKLRQSHSVARAPQGLQAPSIPLLYTLCYTRVVLEQYTPIALFGYFVKMPKTRNNIPPCLETQTRVLRQACNVSWREHWCVILLCTLKIFWHVPFYFLFSRFLWLVITEKTVTK